MKENTSKIQLLVYISYTSLSIAIYIYIVIKYVSLMTENR